MEQRGGEGEADAEGQRSRGAELAAMGVAMEQREEADQCRAERHGHPDGCGNQQAEGHDRGEDHRLDEGKRPPVSASR